MMEEISFNLAVYAVPVLPGSDSVGQPRTGSDERLLQLGDAPAHYLPPPPYLSAATIAQIGHRWV